MTGQPNTSSQVDPFVPDSTTRHRHLEDAEGKLGPVVTYDDPCDPETYVAELPSALLGAPVGEALEVTSRRDRAGREAPRGLDVLIPTESDEARAERVRGEELVATRHLEAGEPIVLGDNVVRRADYRELDAARVARARAAVAEFDSWAPYDTRDAGEVFLAESVRELVRDVRQALA